MNQLGQLHAQPTEEAGGSHAFHHDHHASDEDDGLPVDAGGSLNGVAGLIPKVGAEDALYIQGLPDGGQAVHTQDEHQNHHQQATDKSDDLPFDLIHHDEHKHR